MNSGGCSLCGTLNWDSQPGKFNSEEFEIIRPILTSFTTSTESDSDLLSSSATEVGFEYWNSTPADDLTFCGTCLTLLKEMKRLRVLLKMVTSQLEAVVAKARIKYAEKPVWVKPEKICHENFEESVNENEEEFAIDPFFNVKSETADEEINEDQSDSDELTSEESDDDDGDSEDGSRKRRKVSENSTTVTSGETKKSTAEINSKQHKTKRVKVNRNPARRLRSGKDFFLCNLCDITFKTKLEKVIHLETIHLEGADDKLEARGAMRQYSVVCGKSCTIPGELREHNESCHPAELRFICLMCQPHRQFSSLELIKAHQVIHIPSASSSAFLKCSLCPEGSLPNLSSSFSSPIHLDNHLRRVHFHSHEYISPQNSIGPQCANIPVPKNVKRGGHAKPDPCRFCGFHPNRRGLFGVRVHERKEHPEKFNRICSHPNCGASFAEFNELLTCEETHKSLREGEQFKCYVCNGRFKDQPTLREHLEAKHTKGGFKCDVCDERICIPKLLLNHKAKFHGGEWVHKCPLCGKGESSATILDSHMRIHHKDQQDKSLLPSFLQCDSCPEQFPSTTSLLKHKRRVHLGIVPTFPCDQCEKSFKTASSLRIHEKAHLGVKDHVCRYCGKGFANPNVLRCHLRVHTGEKPFVCHICSKAFNQRTPLTRHLDLHKKNGTWKEKEGTAVENLQSVPPKE